jgi:hypothetical protein
MFSVYSNFLLLWFCIMFSVFQPVAWEYYSQPATRQTGCDGTVVWESNGWHWKEFAHKESWQVGGIQYKHFGWILVILIKVDLFSWINERSFLFRHVMNSCCTTLFRPSYFVSCWSHRLVEGNTFLGGYGKVRFPNVQIFSSTDTYLGNVSFKATIYYSWTDGIACWSCKHSHKTEFYSVSIFVCNKL